jgi:single-stranded DNA-binding protein
VSPPDGTAWTSILPSWGICRQYLRKGSEIYVEGQIRTRKYTDKDGVEKYDADIRVDQMQMLGVDDMDVYANKAGREIFSGPRCTGCYANSQALWIKFRR